MSYPIFAIDANYEISEASKIMEKHKIRRLLVKDNNNIIGIIPLRDVTKSMRYILTRNKLYQYYIPNYYSHKLKK